MRPPPRVRAVYPQTAGLEWDAAPEQRRRMDYPRGMERRILLLATVLLGAPAATFAQAPVDTASQSPMGDEVHHPAKPSVPSSALQVTVPGHPAATFSPADLAALPQVTVAVHNAHTKADESYTGPLVADVLAKAGFVLSEATQHAVLDAYLLAGGTDGYFVLFSAAELQPGLHKTQAIVALTQSGKPLARTGAFQLIEPADVKPARWVRNLQSLTITPVAAAHEGRIEERR